MRKSLMLFCFLLLLLKSSKIKLNNWNETSNDKLNCRFKRRCICLLFVRTSDTSTKSQVTVWLHERLCLMLLKTSNLIVPFGSIRFIPASEFSTKMWVKYLLYKFSFSAKNKQNKKHKKEALAEIRITLKHITLLISRLLINYRNIISRLLINYT